MRLLAQNLFLSAFLLAACSSQDPAPIYFGLSYQLRCLGCQPSSADDSVHTITAIDGEDGYTLTCNANRQMGKRQLSFSATYTNSATPGDTHVIKIQQAFVDGNDPGSLCLVSVREGANTYLGACTSGTPTADQPCQLTFKLVGSTVKGTLYCAGIPNSGTTVSKRYLVAPTTETTPVSFELEGCTGL